MVDNEKPHVKLIDFEGILYHYQSKWYGLVTKPLGAIMHVLRTTQFADYRWETFTQRVVRLLPPYSKDGMVNFMKGFNSYMLAKRKGVPHRMFWVLIIYSIKLALIIPRFLINLAAEIYAGLRHLGRSFRATLRRGGGSACKLRVTDAAADLGRNVNRYSYLVIRKLKQYYRAGEHWLFIRKVLVRVVFIPPLLIGLGILICAAFKINIFGQGPWFDYEIVLGKHPAEVVTNSEVDTLQKYWFNWLKLHDDSFWFWGDLIELDNIETRDDAAAGAQKEFSPLLPFFFVFLALIFGSGEYFDGKFMRRELSKGGKEKEIDERIMDEGSDADTPERVVNQEEGHSVYASEVFKDLKIASGKKLFTKRQVEAIAKEYTFTRTQAKGDRWRDSRPVDEVMENYKKAQEILARNKRYLGKKPKPVSVPFDPSKRRKSTNS